MNTSLRQEAPKIHGGHEERKTNVSEDEEDRIEDEEMSPGGSFRESFDIPTFPPRSSREAILLLLSFSRGEQIRPRIACAVLYLAAKCVRIANASRRNTSSGSGGSIETGREFRGESSKIYSKTADGGRDEECWYRERRKEPGQWCERKRNVERSLDPL